MLNLIDTQDKLKNFSEEQLIKEMQMPSGAAPQFLVLGEINRRQKMRQEAQRQQGVQQSTVAQDAVAAAGVPQGGLADMAGALAPKTDVSGNTGIAAAAEPQRMAEGGRVNKEYPSAAAMWELSNDPATIAMANRMGMSVTEYVRTLAPEAVSALAQRIQRGKENAGRVYDDVFDPNRPAYDQTTPDQLGETFSQMRNNVRDQEVMGMGVNPSFAYDTAMRDYGMGISDVPMTAPVMDSLPSITSGGETRSPRAGGLGSLAEPVVDTAPQEPQGSLRTDINNALDRMYGPEYNMDIGPSSRRGTRAGEQPQPELNAMEALYASGAMDDNLTRHPYITDGPTSRSGFRAGEQYAPYEFVDAEALPDFGPRNVAPRLPTAEEAWAQANEFAGVEAPYGTAESVPAGNPITELLGLGPAMELAQRNRMEGDVSRPAEDLTGVAGADLLPPMPAGETPAAGDTAAETAASTGIAAATTGAGGGAGGSGGGAGGGAGRMSSYEEELMNILKSREASRDQDKWLALAEAGLSMMASKDPNFGVAAGEAGLRAAQTYRQSRDQYDTDRLAIMKAIEDARLARATLAARAASGSTRGSLTANQMVDLAQSRVEDAQGRLDTLAMLGITDAASAMERGRAGEYQQAVQDLSEARSIMGGIYGRVFPGTGESSNVGSVTADISDSSAQ